MRQRAGSSKKSRNTVTALPMLALLLVPVARAATDLTDLSLETLLQTRVTSASKYEQTLDEVPAAATVITRDDIRAYGWRTLLQVLTSMPGSHAGYDRQYAYLGTRGFGLPGDFNTRVLLAINGNRVNNTTYDSAGLGRNFPLDLDLIERIEFIPGPGGAVYGQNAMFGVINVITRSGLQVDGWELATSWQDPQAMHEERLRWGRRFANGTDVLLSFSSMRAQGEDLYLRFPGAAPDGSELAGIARGLDGESDQDISAHLAHGPFAVDVLFGKRSKDDPTAAYFADPLVPGQYERDDHVLTQLLYQQDFGDAVNVQGRLFSGRQRYLGYFAFSGAGNFSTGMSEWYGGELRVLHTGFARHRLMLGVELQDNARADQTNDDYSFDPLRATPAGFLPGGASDLLIERDGYRAGIYAQDELLLTDAVTAALGMRVDRNDSTGTKLSPRAALILQARPDLTLKALYGRANRAPNTYERDYDDGISLLANPALKRESIDTLELVLEQRVSDTLSVRGSVYQWRMQDFVTLGIEPLRGIPQYQSGGDVDAHGAELSANAAWNSGARLRASISYQDAAYDSGANLANSPQWLGRLNYARPLGVAGLSMGTELQFDSERQTNAGSMVDGYWLANVHLLADAWARGLEVSLTLLNLFDERYEHPAADSNWQNTLEQDGRAVRVRLDYRF